MKNKELKDFVYNNVYQNSADGYVLTPSALAFEMISTLPELVFESSETKFLDPICKSGTFLFEIVEKLYDKGHSIKNIESRVYTIDSNYHSLRVANSTIKKILNNYTKIKTKHTDCEWVEKYINTAISILSKGKITTFDDFLNIILIDKNELFLMSELEKNISSFIEQYEKVSKLESKLFGEVFTPRALIEEMLDTLPKEYWTNKDLKWLDPAVGIGNFPSAILDRLMIGLNNAIPNEDERRKHILEEMLYMCDISTKNLFLLYQLFDRNNEFNLKVHRGSFLDENFSDKMNEWGVDKFDVIIGNPPYQDGSKEGGQNKIYNDFCKKSLSLINDSGKVLFITPISVLKKSKRFTLISKKGLKLVDFRSDNFFNVGIKTCFWLFDRKYELDIVKVVSKNNEKNNFNIIDEIIDISEIDIEFFKIKKRLKEVASSPDKRMFLQNSVDATNGRSNIQTDIFKYPVFKIKSGGGDKELVQFNKPKPKLNGLKKIIFPLTKSVNSYIIDDNDYDVNHMFIDVENSEQSDNILSFILSQYFLNHCEKWKKSDGYGFNNALKFLPPFDKNISWDDNRVKNFIESFLN